MGLELIPQVIKVINGRYGVGMRMCTSICTWLVMSSWETVPSPGMCFLMCASIRFMDSRSVGERRYASPGEVRRSLERFPGGSLYSAMVNSPHFQDPGLFRVSWQRWVSTPAISDRYSALAH